jgi:SNF2 family DNA or RNA helicase
VESGPTLVLAPLRVARTTWPDEARKWNLPLDVTTITGTVAERTRQCAVDSAVHATNYEQLPWLIAHWGDKWPYRTVIADEATRLKGFRLRQGGKRTRALGRVAFKHVKRFVELTGTPSPNGLVDLWGPMWFLDQGERLGRTFSAFAERWFMTGYNGFGLSPRAHAQAEITDRIKDLCLTIDPKDWFDLKAPIVTNIYVDLPPAARRIYKEMERQMFAAIGDRTAEAFNAAAVTNKCLQLANGAVYVDPLAEEDAAPRSKEWREVHDAKLAALDSIIEEAAGAPVLVAYNFRSDLARIRAAFPQARVLDSDPDTIRAWNAGEIRLLLAHPASAGHGLNLQDGGNILVYFGHSWNLEEREQILERIGPVRQAQAGHDRGVFVYNLVARDTVDEVVIERLVSKCSVQDALRNAMKRRTA